MGRSKPVFKRQKFKGNIYTRPLHQDASSSNTEYQTKQSSASKNKLSSHTTDHETDRHGYELIDINLLEAALTTSVICGQCKHAHMKINKTSSQGLASQLQMVCNHCTANTKFNTSVCLPEHEKVYEVNMRSVYAFRCIGVGLEGARTFCSIMDLPQPISHFERYNKKIHPVITNVAQTSMNRAAQEAVNESLSSSMDIPVSLDGSWQKRGHKSLNGVVTAMSVDNGKCIDVQCFSKFCQVCLRIDKDDEKAMEEHKLVCASNYSGSSGGMEAAGAKAIFQRSISDRGARYTEYLGDGDSSSFSSVAKDKPYGDTEIRKLECVGHVQKRMGARLRKLKRDSKGTKLSDGKPISGRGRLTDAQIDSIQVYYGMAIRNNTNSVQEMKRAVWATYFHKLSTDEVPQHGLCPNGEDTWCKFKAGKANPHKNSLPKAVMDMLKPIFRDLANEQLLSRCLHGKTQNVNEAINNLIWMRCPKRVFVGSIVLEVGTCDAVICFNEGNIGRLEVMKQMGCIPGRHAVQGLKTKDNKRCYDAERNMNETEKQARKSNRNVSAAAGDKEDSDGSDHYGPGMF